MVRPHITSEDSLEALRTHFFPRTFEALRVRYEDNICKIRYVFSPRLARLFRGLRVRSVSVPCKIRGVSRIYRSVTHLVHMHEIFAKMKYYAKKLLTLLTVYATSLLRGSRGYYAPFEDITHHSRILRSFLPKTSWKRKILPSFFFVSQIFEKKNLVTPRKKTCNAN